MQFEINVQIMHIILNNIMAYEHIRYYYLLSTCYMSHIQDYNCIKKKTSDTMH